MEDGSTLSVAERIQWPSHPGMEQLSQEDPKVKKDAKVGAVFTDGDAIQVDQLLDRFSSWHSLKKFVAYILRYKTSLCKFCVRDKEKPVKPVVKSVIEPIRVPEVREKHFKEEIECLDGCCNCGSKATAQRRFS